MTLKDFQEAIRVDKIRRIQASHNEAVASSAIVRRWDGPNHTADQQCAVCRCWGAENYVNKGNAGITQMLWLCDVCNTPNDQSQATKPAPDGSR